MRHPAQGATGGWVMPGLVFKPFPLCDFSLFDNPYGCRLWGRTESDTTEVMQQQQQQTYRHSKAEFSKTMEQIIPDNCDPSFHFPLAFP